MIKNTPEKQNTRFIATTPEDKLKVLLNNIIDTIEVIDDVVYVKTKCNLMIENLGHYVRIDSGMNVQIAKEIHLNPDVALTKKNFDKLVPLLIESKKCHLANQQ